MRSSAVELDGFTPSLMLENKTPDPNSQPLKIEDILAKAEEIRNARDRQSSVTNSDLGEAFKLFTVVDEESKLLTKKRDLFKPVKLFWNWTGFSEKKLWDIIQIVAVPSALAVAGFWFQDFTKKQDVKLADSKTKQELQVADSKAKQETLTKYLDQMSDMLEKGLLKSKQDSPMFIIAQSKTVTALQSLDTERQRLLIQFFKSANLNTLDGGKGLLFKARMSKAQLQGIDLSGINLSEVDLSGSDLSGSNLKRANLNKANLKGANLSEASLRGSNLDKADISYAILLYTDLNATFLEKKQLENANSPYICGVALPKDIEIKQNDCGAIPSILLKRYPKRFENLDEVERYIGSDRAEGIAGDNMDEYDMRDKGY